MEESFPVQLEGRPNVGLTEQWTTADAEGTKTTRFAGADGYLYERVQKKGEPVRWWGVGRNE